MCSSSRAWLSAVLFFSSSFLMNCKPPPGTDDHYSKLKPRCDFRIPNGIVAIDESKTPYISVFDRHPKGKECLQAFEEALGDRFTESWPGSRDDLKVKLYEALQILLAYPVEIPESLKIFNRFNIPENVISFFTPTAAGESMNQKILNYVLNRIDFFSFYHEAGVYGRYHVLSSELELAPPFFSEPALIRLFALIHEARHYNRLHDLCTENRFEYYKNMRGWSCDNRWNEAFGLEIMYFLFLLHANLKVGKATPYLSFSALEKAAQRVCYSLHHFFREESFPDIVDFVDAELGNKKCEDFGIQNILAWEGLEFTAAMDQERSVYEPSAGSPSILPCGTQNAE